MKSKSENEFDIAGPQGKVSPTLPLKTSIFVRAPRMNQNRDHQAPNLTKLFEEKPKPAPEPEKAKSLLGKMFNFLKFWKR